MKNRRIIKNRQNSSFTVFLLAFVGSSKTSKHSVVTICISCRRRYLWYLEYFISKNRFEAPTAFTVTAIQNTLNFLCLLNCMYHLLFLYFWTIKVYKFSCFFAYLALCSSQYIASWKQCLHSAINIANTKIKIFGITADD